MKYYPPFWKYFFVTSKDIIRELKKEWHAQNELNRPEIIVAIILTPFLGPYFIIKEYFETRQPYDDEFINKL